MTRSFKQTVELIQKQRERRAERVREYEIDKAVIEDDGKPEKKKRGASPKNSNRSSDVTE